MTVHEGHGGSGQPAVLEFRSLFVPPPINSPSTGLPLLIPNQTSLQGLPVTFETPQSATFLRHGALSVPLGVPSFTDVLGQIRSTYTPFPEQANGRGDVRTEVVEIRAVINMEQLLLFMYNAGPLAHMALGIRVLPVPLVIEWHEETATPPPNPGVPGTYTATLIGDAPGAGSHSGSGTIFCTALTRNGVTEWGVSSGPLSGGLSGILMTDDGDRSSVYVTPTGLGMEAQWGASTPAPATTRLTVTGQLANPSVVTGVVEYTYGVNPPEPYSVTVRVTCSDTITN